MTRTLAPTAAIQRRRQRHFVYKLKDDNTSLCRLVKLGTTQATMSKLPMGSLPATKSSPKASTSCATAAHVSGQMIPSRPFILRPVATTLLMAAILLVGIVGFNFFAALGPAASGLPDI